MLESSPEIILTILEALMFSVTSDSLLRGLIVNSFNFMQLRYNLMCKYCPQLVFPKAN